MCRVCGRKSPKTKDLCPRCKFVLKAIDYNPELLIWLNAYIEEKFPDRSICVEPEEEYEEEQDFIEPTKSDKDQLDEYADLMEVWSSKTV